MELRRGNANRMAPPGRPRQTLVLVDGCAPLRDPPWSAKERGGKSTLLLGFRALGRYRITKGTAAVFSTAFAYFMHYAKKRPVKM